MVESMQKAMRRLAANTSKKRWVLSMWAWMILRSLALEQHSNSTSLGFFNLSVFRIELLPLVMLMFPSKKHHNATTKYHKSESRHYFYFIFSYQKFWWVGSKNTGTCKSLTNNEIRTTSLYNEFDFYYLYQSLFKNRYSYFLLVDIYFNFAWAN